MTSTDFGYLLCFISGAYFGYRVGFEDTWWPRIGLTIAWLASVVLIQVIFHD